MNEILDLLTDYTFVMIALGSGLLGLLSGIMGVYVTVKNKGLSAMQSAIQHYLEFVLPLWFLELKIWNFYFLELF